MPPASSTRRTKLARRVSAADWCIAPQTSPLLAENERAQCSCKVTSNTLVSAGMDLLTYVSDMSRRDSLAKAVGKNPAYLWQVATSRRRASPELAIAIQEATGGEVPKHELRADLWSAPEAKAA